MKSMDVVVAILVVVGAINWGLVGVFQFDAVASLFGEATALSKTVYILVGCAGLFQGLQWKAIQRRWSVGPAMMPA